MIITHVRPNGVSAEFINTQAYTVRILYFEKKNCPVRQLHGFLLIQGFTASKSSRASITVICRICRSEIRLRQEAVDRETPQQSDVHYHRGSDKHPRRTNRLSALASANTGLNVRNGVNVWPSAPIRMLVELRSNW